MKIKILLTIVLALLCFFWFIGVKTKLSSNEIETILNDTDGVLLVIYDNQGYGKVWVQSINKFGIQKTIYSEESLGEIYGGHERGLLYSISDSSMKVNLAKPLYYAKIRYFLKHYKQELASSSYDSSLSVESPETYSGYIRYKDLNSNTFFLMGVNSNTFGRNDFWRYICLNSGVSRHIDKKDLMPHLFRKEYKHYYSRKMYK